MVAPVGRFKITPAAPVSECSTISKTVRTKFGSAREFDAMRKFPLRLVIAFRSRVPRRKEGGGGGRGGSPR
jgi:hypothetical protein